MKMKASKQHFSVLEKSETIIDTLTHRHTNIERGTDRERARQ